MGMRTIALILPFLFCSTLLFGQLDSNSITVTASRTAALAPDEAVFRVTADGPASTTLADAVNALQSVGITAANFASVSTGITFGVISPNPPTTLLPGPFPASGIQWSFNLVTPLTQIKDTLAALSALQTVSQPKPITVSFSLQGTQVSTRSANAQVCSPVDLLADARAKAQKYADAAGLNVGTILAMSSSTLTQTPSNIVLVNFYNTITPLCSVTVKFALGRYVQ